MRTPDDSVQHVLTLEVDADRADRLTQWLSDEWALAAAQFVRPGGDRSWLEIYFATDVEAEIAGRALAGQTGVRGWQVRRSESRDWLRFWRHHFKTQDLGDRLRICPVWDRPSARARGRKVILVDPGASFGTGDHFTTRFCLETIDRLCRVRGLRTLLDVGTGSGILAIAAVKLGCARAVGTDVDEVALRQAAANLRLNGVRGKVTLRRHDVTKDPIRGRFDIVAANILSSVLQEVSYKLVAAARRRLVLSGIRESEVEGVVEAFMAQGAVEVARDGDGEWAGVVLATDVQGRTTR